MTIGAVETSEPTRFVLPHRVSRLVLNAVLLGLIAALLAGIVAEPAKNIVLTCWVLIACVVLVRTWRSAITVDDVRLVAVTGIATKRVKRSEITRIDLLLPQVGEFTQGGGERMIAVLKNGKQISLTFNPLIMRHWRHLSEMARALNGLVGQSPA
jgi:small-conductance mechanosensitive channel